MRYGRIINLPRPASCRPKMSALDRAAQFSAFAALVGLDELLEARATETDEMVLGSFKDGFKIGMRLTVEGLSSNFIDEE